MSVMEKLKALFRQSPLPEETRRLLDSAATPAELIRGLEETRGRNEMEMRRLEEELADAESQLVVEEAKIRSGSLTPALKTATLRRIERLGKQVTNIDGRISVYNANTNLHLDLIGRVQMMEATQLRGVGEDEIDKLLGDVDEAVKDWERVQSAGGEAAAPVLTGVRREEDKRLADLERQIMGTPGPEPAATTRTRKPELE